MAMVVEGIGALGFFVADSVLAFMRRTFRVLLRPFGSRKQGRSRLAPLHSRTWSTDLGLSHQFAAAVQRSKWNRTGHSLPAVHWKGIRNVKDPFELAIYPMLLWELKPATIIEIGSLNGGSAVWLADMLDVMKIDGKVFSFDIDTEQIKCDHARVTFARADSNHLDLFDTDLLRQLPHPWLVIEDAHQNVANVLSFFGEFMTPGDYLVVEDTLQWKKYLEMKKFVARSRDLFRVDTRYTDLFGYNATWNINGYLKRV